MYPSESVVTAMIESYLSMRKATWNLTDEDGKLIAPEKDSEPAHKIDTCKAILQKLDSNFLVTTDWIKLVDDLYKAEQQEQKFHDNLWAPRRWFGSRLLLETLKAVRSYVLTELYDNNAQFEAHMKQLKKTKEDTGILFTSKSNLKETNKPEEITAAGIAYEAATKALEPFDLDAIKYEQKGHLQYFEKYILPYDPQAKIDALNEKSFTDFTKNAMQHKRTTVLCTKLLSKTDRVDNIQAFFEIPVNTVPVSQKKADIPSLQEAAAKTAAENSAAKSHRSSRRKPATTKDGSPATESKSTSTTRSALRANSAIQTKPYNTRSRSRSRVTYADQDNASSSNSNYRKY